VHAPATGGLDGTTVDPRRGDNDAEVCVDGAEGSLEVRETGAFGKGKKICLLGQYSGVDVDEGDDLDPVGKMRQEATNPAAGHTSGPDHQATLFLQHGDEETSRLPIGQPLDSGDHVELGRHVLRRVVLGRPDGG